MMFDSSRYRETGSRARSVATAAAAALLPAILTGCSELLEVSAPQRVPESTLAQPENAPQLVEGVRADLGCAFVNFTLAGGLIGDEIQDAQLTAAEWDLDRRTITSDAPYAEWTCGTGAPATYQALTTARWQADNAERILSGFSDEEVPGSLDRMLAEVNAFAGYSRLLLGEVQCRAGSLVEEGGDLVPGPAVTAQELFALAEEDFTAAIERAQAAEAPSLAAMARLGRARSRINQGNGSGAADDARQVPEGFEFFVETSGESFRSSNQIFTGINRDEQYSIEEDFRNLQVQGVPDPRVPVTDAGKLAAGDDQTPLYTQGKYTTREDRVRLASWDEAQLIIAEAELGQTAVDVINRFHDMAGLPAFEPDDPSDDAEILGHLYEERRRELFLESQHLFTKLRFQSLAEAMGLSPEQLNPNLVETPSAGADFPKGGTYGDLTCAPLPDVESENNPNI